MSIYVDKLFTYPTENIAPRAKRYGRRWCHLVTDGDIEELHAFAEHIGCHRSWFQKHPRMSHYDLTPTMRARAVAAGATEVQTLQSLFKKLLKSERK
jgi:hypothetical protein